MSTPKGKLLNVRLAKAEYDHLKALADNEAMSVSDYVRRRLFEDHIEEVGEFSDRDKERQRFECEHEKEVMRALIRVLAMIQALCKETLTKDKLIQSYEVASQQLREWGYE